MKKALICLIVTLSLLVGLLACTGIKGPDNGGTGTPALAEKKDVYAFSALTSVKLLSMSAPAATSFGVSMYDASAEKTISEESKSEMEAKSAIEQNMDEINRYLNLFESLLAESPIQSVEEASDREGYETRLTITVSDLDGATSEYVMYYNETVFPPDEDDDDDEREIESELEGIMILDGCEYAVEGKRELEEDEAEVTFLARIDRNHYIKVKQEIEPDEQKFVYERIENGRCVSKSEIKIEQESDETEIELEFLEGETRGVYRFDRETENGKTEIKILADVNGSKTVVRVSIVENPVTGELEYEYRFTSGSKVKKPRDNGEYLN